MASFGGLGKNYLRKVEKNVLYGDFSGGLRNLFEGGRFLEALHAVKLMDYQATTFSINALYVLLQGCIERRDLASGRDACCLIIRNGYESNVFLRSHLIRMFASCGCLHDAVDVFHKLHRPNVFAWSVIIIAHAKLGEGKQAVRLFYEMQQSSVQPDACVFVAVLKACSIMGDLTVGMLVHACIVQIGMEFDVSIGNTTIGMYIKCGSLEHACRLFDKLPKRNVVTWSAMITGYVQHGFGEKALELFCQMKQDGIEPNSVTFISIIKACEGTKSLEQGKLIHSHIIESGLESDLCIGNTLIDMYAKCGYLEDAQSLFEKLQVKDVVTWNALIAGYAQHGHGQMSLKLFHKMQHNGKKPDNFTYASLLKVCSSISGLHQGKMIHGYIIEMGIEADAFVGSKLIDMYVICGNFLDARKVFDRLHNQDVVIWSALIGGYAQNGQCQEALQLFERMQQEGKNPDKVLFISILMACASLSALEQGKLIHADIADRGFESDLLVGNSLIDMYSKCGCLDVACRVFDSLPNRDLVSWNAIITGFGLHGDYNLAWQYFEAMQRECLKPDEVSFVCLLCASSYMGLVDKACSHFNSMRLDHGIVPELEHYNCMVELLGCVGSLTEAEDLLLLMPFQFNVAGWTSLLGNCRRYRCVELGRLCFDHIAEMDDEYAFAFVHMSGIYADANMWEDVEKMQKLKRSVKAWKEPGMSFIEFDNKVHDFLVGDQTHPQDNAISAKLESLSVQMKAEGHIPTFAMTLHFAFTGN